MALLAGLPLDIVDALSNGHAEARDICSLRLASSSLRARVDQTLQRLRPNCDLSSLRLLPSTFSVLACVDLSAVDLRLLSSSQLLASSGGLTRHLELTLSQMPCLTELTISEAFAREMGRKCWAAAVCNSIFKDVASEQQQRHKQQQQQQQQQVAALMLPAHAAAPAAPPAVLPAPMLAPEEVAVEESTAAGTSQRGVPTSHPAHSSSPQLDQQQLQQQQQQQQATHALEAAPQQQQEHHVSQEHPSSSIASEHESEAASDTCDLSVNGHLSFLHGSYQVPGAVNHGEQEDFEVWGLAVADLNEQWWFEQQQQQLLAGCARCDEEKEEDGCMEEGTHDEDDAHEQLLLRRVLNPGPSCLLDCPRELMWSSGFRAFDPVQFTISPASPPASCTPSVLSPTANHASAASPASEANAGADASSGRCDDAGREHRTDQSLRGCGGSERAGLTFASVPPKRPSRGAMLEAPPSCPPQPVSMRWGGMEPLAPPYQGLDAASTTARLLKTASPATLSDAAESASGGLEPEAESGPAAGAATLPCAYTAARLRAEGSASCGLLSAQSSLEQALGDLSEVQEGGTASSSRSGSNGALDGAAVPAEPYSAEAKDCSSSSGGGSSTFSSMATPEPAGLQTLPGVQATRNEEGPSSSSDAADTTSTFGTAPTMAPAAGALADSNAAACNSGIAGASTAIVSTASIAASDPGVTASSDAPSSCSEAALDPNELAYFHAAAEDPHANMSAVVWLPDWPARLPKLHTLRIRSGSRPIGPSCGAGMGQSMAGHGAGIAAVAGAGPVGGDAGAAGPSNAVASAGSLAGAGLAAGAPGMTTLLWARRSTLGRIRTLDLSGTRLGTLPPDLLSSCLPSSLHSLRLAGCGLVSLPPSLFSLVSLRHLDVSSNVLRELPDQLSRLLRLQQLDASDNQLTCLPASLGACTALERLCVTGNQLRSPSALPLKELSELPALSWLSLAHNWLGVDGSNGGSGGVRQRRRAVAVADAGVAAAVAAVVLAAVEAAEAEAEAAVGVVPEGVPVAADVGAHAGGSAAAAAAAAARFLQAQPVDAAAPAAAAGAAAAAAGAVRSAAASPPASASSSSLPASSFSRSLLCWAPAPAPVHPQPLPWLHQLLTGRAAASLVHLNLSHAGTWDQLLVLPWAACLALKSLRHLSLSGNCGGLLLGPVPAGLAAAGGTAAGCVTAGGAAAGGAAAGVAAASGMTSEGHQEVHVKEELGCGAPLPALKHLDLSQCALEDLPDILSLLPGLETLDLRGNCLAALPPWAPCMAGLRQLRLSGNADLLLALEGGVEGVESVAAPCVCPETQRWLRGVAVHKVDRVEWMCAR